MNLYITILLASLMTISCGSARNTSKSDEVTVTSSNNTSQMNKTEDENACRLIVSFISIGEGTDPEARRIMDGVLDKWAKKAGKPIASEAIPWGREGEVDFCFYLKELSSGDQALFVKEMKEAMEGRNLIQFAENQESRNKR
jgi:hypothetical protein